jgi:pyridoxal phosphate enzyme (YggS family)
MLSSGTIQARIASIQQTLPASMRLIAVTKYVAPAAMRQAYAAGIRDFGENRVQDAMVKQAQLSDLTDITWHLIGHLQTNKAKLALKHFAWIHTLDSLNLAQRLDQYADQYVVTPEPETQERGGQLPWGQLPQVLLQVKILPDPNKFGWSVSELWQALPQLDQFQHLQIRGLMAILPQGLNPDQQWSAFGQVQTLAAEIQSRGWQRLKMDQLSMGMSGDYPLAIQAGATMIRLGTLLFSENSESNV